MVSHEEKIKSPGKVSIRETDQALWAVLGPLKKSFLKSNLAVAAFSYNETHKMAGSSRDCGQSNNDNAHADLAFFLEEYGKMGTSNNITLVMREHEKLDCKNMLKAWVQTKLKDSKIACHVNGRQVTPATAYGMDAGKTAVTRYYKSGELNFNDEGEAVK